MAHFFARFRPANEANQYARLLPVLGQARTTFATLNYDCILEATLEALGIPFTYGIPFSCGIRAMAHSVLALKPHGSCNFVMPPTMKVIDSTFHGNHRLYEGPIVAVSPRQLESIYAEGGSMPPALSMYLSGKATLTGERVIGEIRKAWDACVREADVVMTIGVRPVLADAHIWNPILETSADFWFVGGREGDFDAIQKEIGSRLTVLAHYFEDAVPLIAERLRTQHQC